MTNYNNSFSEEGTRASRLKSPSLQETLEHVRLIAVRTLAFWPVMVVACCFGIVAYLLVPKLLPPVYASSMVLSYREVIQQEALLGNNLMPAENRRSRNTRLKERLLSRSTLEPIIQAHGLHEGASSDGEMATVLDSIRGQIRCDISEGDTFKVAFRGRSRREAYEVTRALGKALMEIAKDYGVEQAEATRSFLQAQLDAAFSDLVKAEQRLAEFLARHPEFALPEGVQATNRFANSTASRASRAGGSLVPSRSSGGSRPAPSPASSSPGAQARNPAGALAAVPAAEAYSALRAAEADVGRARENLIAKKSQYTDIHPDVTAAQNAMDAALARLRNARIRVQEAEEAVSATASSESASSPSSPSDAPKTVDTVAAVEGTKAPRGRGGARAPAITRPASSEGTPADERVVALETEWTTVSREAGLARERNEQIERQLFRVSMLAEVQTSGGGSRIVVLDPPFEPRSPTQRGPKRVGALAFVIVQLLGVGLSVALALMDGRVWTEADVVACGIGQLVHTVPPLATSSRGHA